MRVVESKNGSTVRYVGAVRYASIFAQRYGTLVRYAFFGMVQVRYASKIQLKYGTLVRYGSRCEVRSTQIPNVPYRTAILAWKCKKRDIFVVHFGRQINGGWGGAIAPPRPLLATHTNWYEPQLEVQVPVGNEGHKEASNHIPFECKVFCGYCKYFFRSKAQLMLRN